MADVEGLKEKVRRHGELLAAAALELIKLDLDAVVPDSDRSPDPDIGGRQLFGQKLRDSRETILPQLQGDTVSATITYTSFKAELTNIGPEPHTIPTGGRDAQLAKGYPLRFWSRQAGAIVYAWETNWVPGDGVEANKGWFQRGLGNWADHLQAATSQVVS